MSYQQAQQDEERRRREEEGEVILSMLAAKRCPQHPERPMVDAGVCTKQCCEECYDNALRNYADVREENGFYAARADTTGWMYGAADKPTYSKSEDRK